MRIVDIINLSSSADTLLRERVLALRAKGVDNRIVCSDGPYVRPLRSLGIPVATLPIPRGMNPFLLAWSLMGLWLHLRRVKPDLVHTHCSVPGIVGRIAARLAGVPVVVHTVHGFAFHGGSRGPLHA
ncbi:MAG: glycosyltransferase family 4 protein, partial [Deltaproteobacteria bacterium]